ncbi:MAG: hypothetical protein ACRD12_00210, partial [Acidimicrobiales bacterium]
LETLRRLACDCGVVRHLLRGPSQPLDIGTRTSVWTVAQRRAISVRDRGRCRFVGCEHRTCSVPATTPASTRVASGSPATPTASPSSTGPTAP